MIHAFLLAVATLAPSQVDGMLAKAEAAFNDYVFPDVASRAVDILRRNRAKYEAIHDPEVFKGAVDADLYAVTHDKHVRLRYPYTESQQFSGHPSPSELAAQHRSELASNFGFQTARRLPGNVGYVDFRYFSGDASVGQTIAGAMMLLSHTDALIFDLRQNGGGDPIAAQTLEAYLFDGQQQITSLRMRDPKTGVVSELQQYTAPTVPGPLYLHKPVYLLTSSHTFSCAEQFVYDLHNLKRVTIVGETTGGGANPGRMHAIGSDFGIFIPQGYAFSPVTKSNWEGTGITPDVGVPAAEALTRAYDGALNYVKAHEIDVDTVNEAKLALTDEVKALSSQP